MFFKNENSKDLRKMFSTNIEKRFPLKKKSNVYINMWGEFLRYFLEYLFHTIKNLTPFVLYKTTLNFHN